MARSHLESQDEKPKATRDSPVRPAGRPRADVRSLFLPVNGAGPANLVRQRQADGGRNWSCVLLRPRESLRRLSCCANGDWNGATPTARLATVLLAGRRRTCTGRPGARGTGRMRAAG